MEYQKIINFVENETPEPSKFRIKNWIEINDQLYRTDNTNSQIKFKITMLKSSLSEGNDNSCWTRNKRCSNRSR